MIEIYAFPASYGESILVCLGENENRKNILIDAGFISTYNNHIKSKLIELNKKKLALDVLVFTHFDADHISGGIKLLVDNASNAESQIIHIKNIWLNRLRHIDFNNDKRVSLNEGNSKVLQRMLEKKYPAELYNSGLTDISAEQCLTISQLIDSGGYNSNKDAIVFSENSDKNIIYLDEKIRITILSPTKEKLNELKAIWIDELLKRGVYEDSNNNHEVNEAFEKIMVNIIERSKTGTLKNCSNAIDIIQKILDEDNFVEDESKVNGSSMAFIIEYEKKRMLFLGDCHPSIVEKYIKDILKKTQQRRMKFDLINISHHGSRANTSQNLLDLLDCGKFLICTNGKKFGHPDDETLARIIASNKNKDKEIILNYKIHSIKKFLDENLMKVYKYSIKTTNKTTIRNSDCKSTYIKL